jgi:hypothetical protein
MRKSTALIPLALLTIAAFPVAAQEMPRVLFCMGQCLGVDEAGTRVPLNKGSRLAPGQRLETGPDSYAQVKLGADTACGIGERSRVRFDHRVRDRDVVILDQGRIRLIGGEAIGRPGLRPVELHTTDGKFDLRSADIEVKTLPKTADAPQGSTLVKLNIGEARLGDLPVSKDAVQGVVGGKILDRTIAIGEIALPTPRREAAPAKTGEATTPAVRESFVALPVVNLPATEFKPIAEPVKVSTAIMSTELLNSKVLIDSPTLSKTAMSTLLVSDPAQTIKPYVPPVDSSMLVKAYPISTPTGSTSLNTISKQLQDVQKTTSLSTSTSTTTITAPLAQQEIFKAPTQTTTLTSPIFSPRITTTNTLLR